MKGPTPLHNAVMTTLDIRAGAAVVLAALAAKGTSTILVLKNWIVDMSLWRNVLKNSEQT